LRGNFDKSAPVQHKESFILAHAGTCAPRQHITRRPHETDDIIRGLDYGGRSVAARVGSFHCNSRYIDLVEFQRLYLNGNKMKRICSIILGGMMFFATVAPIFAQAASPAGHVTVVVHPDLRTGKLIRGVVVQPREVVPPREEAARIHEPLVEPISNVSVPLSSNIIEMIDQIARAYDVEGPLVHSVIRAESNYNPQAVSNKGALGMMQLIPSTARRFGVRNPFDPKQNIEGGVRYLRFLLDYYKNDYKKTIAAYNAGEGAVDRYQGIPPYTETRNYVSQVARNLKAARQAEEAKIKVAEAKATSVAEPDAGEYKPIRASVAEDGRVYYRTQ
jgi:hypothetical protein